MQYLLDAYDKENKISISVENLQDRASFYQWMFFQSTFQNPAISAAFYYKRNAPAEAGQRYIDETIRVLKVLDDELSGRGTGENARNWLVGQKCTAADLAFLPAFWSIPVSDNIFSSGIAHH